MKVIKIGGGCLKGKKQIAHILDLITERGRGHIFVVSALYGITDMLIEGMAKAIKEEESIPALMNHLRSKHTLIARHLMPKGTLLKDFIRDLNRSLNQVERFYYGLNFTRESTPRMRDVISSYGERFSAELLAAAVRARGVQSTYLLPEKIGIMTDGKFEDATADLRKTARNLQPKLTPLLSKGMILFLPGFFGVSEKGDITTFGRGGSDYSAAVVAAAMEADGLEIWKDVPGYLSTDPNFVEGARLIPLLSYKEAAELSYFGAKILHPRTMEPLKASKLNIAVKNTLDPDASGSLITYRGITTENVVKSVAHDTDIGILKVHASGVGARPGILALIAGQLAEKGINIKSVVTSQTCISLLLSHKDLEAGHDLLKSLSPKPYQRLEKVEDIALIGIVGDGLVRHKGVAARSFTAVAECDINIEMSSFGPSRAALYFIVSNKDLQATLTSIHKTFFSEEEAR